jgi:hypothetical protein
MQFPNPRHGQTQNEEIHNHITICLRQVHWDLAHTRITSTERIPAHTDRETLEEVREEENDTPRDGDDDQEHGKAVEPYSGEDSAVEEEDADFGRADGKELHELVREESLGEYCEAGVLHWSMVTDLCVLSQMTFCSANYHQCSEYKSKEL